VGVCHARQPRISQALHAGYVFAGGFIGEFMMLVFLSGLLGWPA